MNLYNTTFKKTESYINVFFSFLMFQSNEEITLIPKFPKNCTGVMWDCIQPHVFIAFDEKISITYVYVKHSVEGMDVLNFLQ